MSGTRRRKTPLPPTPQVGQIWRHATRSGTALITEIDTEKNTIRLRWIDTAGRLTVKHDVFLADWRYLATVTSVPQPVETHPATEELFLFDADG